jgi:probable F420-dependent oxidoreductase
VKLACALFPTDEAMAPQEVAQLAEERGFESLWFPEHTHIPASRATAYPAGGDLPSMYWHSLDPFVALTAAAVATTELRLGTGICLVVERDPIITAKEVASLDLISEGRVEFGVGAGWNREEMRNHGTDPRVRMAVMRERVEAIKTIWTESEASYAGEHVNFDRIWSWPKPVQDPHPSVWVGGNLLRRIAALRSRAGFDVPVTINASPRRPERLARYAEAGVERAIFYLPSSERDEIEQRMDDVQASWAQLTGAA